MTDTLKRALKYLSPINKGTLKKKKEFANNKFNPKWDNNKTTTLPI